MQDTDVLIKYINLFHACWAQMVVKVTETDHRGTQRERFILLSLGFVVFFLHIYCVTLAILVPYFQEYKI